LQRAATREIELRSLAIRIVVGKLRNEIEARGTDSLTAATDYAASEIARRHGNGEIAGKIQAHVIVAVA